MPVCVIDSEYTHPRIYLARARAVNYVVSSHELLVQSAITLIPTLLTIDYSWNSLLLPIVLLHHGIPRDYDSGAGVPCASDCTSGVSAVNGINNEVFCILPTKPNIHSHSTSI